MPERANITPRRSDISSALRSATSGPGSRRSGNREETFCCGPLSCPHYKAGRTRKVPGRNGMTWEEEDWIDQEAVSHRDPDD